MLYLKNAGEFLNELAKVGVNIVLHGHQHDPCDFSINYNIGGESDAMVVLSAGTALKKRDDEKPFSRQTHYYVLGLIEDKLYVQSMDYHGDSASFVPNKMSVKDLRIGTIASYELELSYSINDNGNLEEEGVAYYKAKPNKTIGEISIGFGVDEESPPEPQFNNCNFGAFRSGVQIQKEHIIVEKDGPKEKLVKIVLDPPITEVQEKISWSLTWVGGWKNLIAKGRDEGSFFIDKPTDKLTVRFINKCQRATIGQLEVMYKDERSIKRLESLDTKETGFQIIEPVKYHSVYYKILNFK